MNRTRLDNDQPAISVSGLGIAVKYGRRVNFKNGDEVVAAVVQDAKSVYMIPEGDTDLEILGDI